MTKAQLSKQLDNHIHPVESWNLKYKTTKIISIVPIENGEGSSYMRFKAHNRLWEFEQTKDLDLNYMGLNGIIDGIPLTASNFYLLWLILNDTATDVLGFGVTKQPKATIASLVDGTKGSITTLNFTASSLPNCAYQFTVGARVSCYFSNTDYNLGTIVEITDTDTIKVLMDNNANYGTTLVGAGTVIQQDMFRPWQVGNSYANASQSLAYTNYKLLSGGIRINASSNIQYFMRNEKGWIHWNDYVTMVFTLGGIAAQIYQNGNLVPPTARLIQCFPYWKTNAVAGGYWHLFWDYVNNSAIASVYGYGDATAPYNGGTTFIQNQDCLVKIQHNNNVATNYLAVTGFQENLI